MTDSNTEQSLIHCAYCNKVFDVSDAEDFEKFCTSKCENEHRQEWAEFRREESEDEIAHEEVENMRAAGDSLQDWVR